LDYHGDVTGVADFERLVTEGVVDWNGEAPDDEVYAAAERSMKRGSKGTPPTGKQKGGDAMKTPSPDRARQGGGSGGATLGGSSGGGGYGYGASGNKPEKSLEERREEHLQKLTQLYLKMREFMGEALGERERCVNQRKSMIDNLVKYSFGGDLDRGLAMMNELKKDDGSKDPTRESMAMVSKVSKILNELSKESREIFTNKEARKAEMKMEILRLRSELGDAKKKEAALLDRADARGRVN
jgi:hypothetical protein